MPDLVDHDADSATIDDDLAWLSPYEYEDDIEMHVDVANGIQAMQDDFGKLDDDDDYFYI